MIISSEYLKLEMANISKVFKWSRIATNFTKNLPSISIVVKHDDVF